MAKAAPPPPDHVSLWCGTCHKLVSIRPTRITRDPRQPVIYRVTPDAWTDHRTTTHGETK